MIEIWVEFVLWGFRWGGWWGGIRWGGIFIVILDKENYYIKYDYVDDFYFFKCKRNKYKIFVYVYVFILILCIWFIIDFLMEKFMF